MGIDIYMTWEGQTQDEKEAQYAGFSVQHGHVGYLREAYHGNPYATKHLVQEAFESDDGEAFIDAETLRKRLPETLKLHIKRELDIYGNAVNLESPSTESFIAFVELAERLTKQGKPPRIIASY